MKCEGCGEEMRWRDAALICRARDRGHPIKGNAMWLVACHRCSTGFVYWIDTFRLRKWNGPAGSDTVEGWAHHLRKKDWFAGTEEDYLAAAHRMFGYQREPEPKPKKSRPGKRQSLTLRQRFVILKRDGFRCVYCGAHGPGVVLHIDHATSLHDGGSNHHSNLVTACSDCNLGKGRLSINRETELN